jgi:hypothetical protein
MSSKSRKRKAALGSKVRANGQAKKPPSKEMGLQMNQFALLKCVAKVLSTKEQTEKDDLTVGEWAARCTDDPHEREKLIATWVIVKRCDKEGKDIFSVSKIVVWRDPTGLNKDIQVEFGARASVDMLRAAGLLKSDTQKKEGPDAAPQA